MSEFPYWADNWFATREWAGITRKWFELLTYPFRVERLRAFVACKLPVGAKMSRCNPVRVFRASV